MFPSTFCSLVLCALVLNGCWALDLLPNPITGENDAYKTFSFWKIDDKDIDRSIIFSAKTIDNLKRLEENILNAQIAAHKKITVSNADDEAKQTARSALIVEKATTQLISRFCYKNKLSTAKCAQIMHDYNATNTVEPGLHKECTELSQDCTFEQLNNKYRQQSGACNHKYSPSLGQALTTYKRLLNPIYTDGIHSFKRSVTKKFVLPSARVVSERMIQRESDNMPSGRFTVAFAHWGEFVEHDLAQTVSHKMVHFDSSINCCTPDGNKLAPRHIHPFCSAIEVPNDDKFYGDKNVKCLSYVRSMGGLRGDCSFGPLDQLNQATHYLDGSQIYGNDEEQTKSLRNGIRGQMRHSQNFLPKEEHFKENEMKCREDKNCYEAGDSRANSHPQLTALHTIFLREHNRLAEKLSELNPHWNDEKLFEEARRVLIAEIQHITYDEWLPLLLSKDDMNKMAAREYQDVVNPAVSNSFATAAVRFIKSLIPEKIQLFNEDRTLNSSLNLGDHLYKTHIIEAMDLNQFLRGLTTQKSRKLDLAYTKDLVDLHGSELLGLDVISLDIQRGRDHGLPGYNAYRKLCGLRSARVFNDLLDNIAPEEVKKLSQVYNHPDDIDLIIGGLAETPKKDSVVGETFACILADQFRRTREGDRYFYSFINSRKPWEFTSKQIEEIQKVTLSKIICDNADVESVQPEAFLPISNSNQLTKCHDLPGLNLSLWKD